MKHKVYALCGIFWFIMDCFWFWKFYYPAFVFGILTVVTSVSGMLIYHRKQNTEYYVVLATFAWIMLNMCAVTGDLYAKYETLNQFLKLFGFISCMVGAQAIIAIAIYNRNLFEKFKKL